MRKLFLASALGLVTLATACGPTCQSTCDRLYLESSCNIQRAGRTLDELIGYCMGECEAALNEPGELGDYDPYERSGSGVSVTLGNEKQAAVWMECVAAQDCSRLEDGYCAPIW